jgi:hypothetical protein
VASIPHDQLVAVLNKTDPKKLTSAQKSRVARLLQNAATRHLLDERFLSPAQRTQRTAAVQGAQPIVPGSSVTNRDLAQQTKVAEALKYGQQETQLNQDLAARQRQAMDQAGWFDQYQAQLAQHQANTAQINQQAVGQQQALTGSVGAIQAPPSATPVPGAVPSAQNVTDAQNATALRQALTASFGAMMSQQGAAANTYADTLSHVVAPTQKLSAQAQGAGNVELARKALIQEAADKGLFGEQFQSQFKQDEAKNVLASQIAQVNADQGQAKIDLAAKTLNVDAKAKTASAKTQSSKAKETARHNRATEANQAAGQKSRADAAAGKVNQYGYTDAAWRAMSTAGRQKVIKDFQSKPKAKDKAQSDADAFKAKYGVAPVGTVQVGNARDSITSAQSYVNELKSSGNDRHTVANLLLQGGKVPTDQKDSKGKPVMRTYPKQRALWLSVALDLAYLGGISNGTADRLHRAGYSAKQLGLKPIPQKPVTANLPGFGQVTAPPFSPNPPRS